MNLLESDFTYLLLKKMCDVCVLRHRVIAQNIANIDTPGYKARRVIFEDFLKESKLKEAAVKSNPEIRIDFSGTLREDLNNVDIEREIVNLSINSLRYSIYLELLSRKLEKIKLAIKGSGR